MASRIQPTRAFHRWQVDVEIQTAIAFDEMCIANGQRATQRIRELIEAEVAAANTGSKKKGKK